MKSLKNIREGNVIYSVDCDRFDPVVISAKNVNTNKELRKVYNLQYPNAIFGYDCSDVAEINNILDNFINELNKIEKEDK